MVDGIAERQAVRRRALLDAGVVLLGAQGGPAVNVRAVCRATGITERYFYELFGSRDDYVRAVYDDVSVRARDVLLAASEGHPDIESMARAGVDAFVHLMIGDPDRGRVLLLAPYREPVLATEGLSHLPDFFGVVEMALPADLDEVSRRLTAVELVGALTALFTQFLGGALSVSRDRLVEHCVAMLLGAVGPTRRP
jgi:AcrR family transcriptional regulator